MTNPRLWKIAAYLMMAVSILRGIRFPNIWSYSHFLFNYEYGFVKRGLIGEFLRIIGIPALASYPFFFFFSMALFFGNIFLICVLISRLIESRNPLLTGGALVYSSSLGVVFLAHCVGYFDQTGLFLALLIILVKSFRRKCIVLLAGMPVVLLIHEGMLVLFFPLMAVSLFFAMGDDSRKRKFGYLILSAVVFTAGALFVAKSTIQFDDARRMLESIQSRVPFPLRPNAFDVLFRSAADNLAVTRQYWSQDLRFLELGHSLAVTAPVGFLLAFLIVTLLKHRGMTSSAITLVVFAALSPLLLHFAGWDMHRWNTLAVTTMFLMLYVVYASGDHSGTISCSRPELFLALVVLIVFLNGVSSIRLFDGYYVKQFPFLEHQRFLMELFEKGDLFFRLPSS